MVFVKMVLISMRPKQWIKNLIIFAPVAFAQKLFDPPMFLVSLAAFCCFCLASSGVYLLNDVTDREADRHHPEKKDRPIASGRLSVAAALAGMAALFTASFVGAFLIRPLVLLVVVAYVALNVSYSFALKRIVIIDAFSIAFGFILRMLAGGEALRRIDPSIVISTWIILCTLLGSLFLAFCKRRQELGLEEKAADHRSTLNHYGVSFLDQMISISCAATVMAYALWTMWPETVRKFGTQRLFWTVPFVCYGIFRYLYIVHQKNEGGSPSKVFLTDRPLQINILLWIVTVILVLYGKKLIGLW
ncbi:MAG TPA: decaprenyl-phosphate phosphoribosyltransferase [bacterium]|nr:decaprenyl-phosphate phosphoribosyltransferase [bacterium]